MGVGGGCGGAELSATFCFSAAVAAADTAGGSERLSTCGDPSSQNHGPPVVICPTFHKSDRRRRRRTLFYPPPVSTKCMLEFAQGESETRRPRLGGMTPEKLRG